jgi:DNA (cytosine-5)-methyltransferase 1
MRSRKIAHLKSDVRVNGLNTAPDVQQQLIIGKQKKFWQGGGDNPVTGAYYNEHDRFAAEWLRNLIKAGLIADGEVDERSIEQVEPADLKGFIQCHFFAGIGGWPYALKLSNWPDSRPVWTGSPPCQPYSAAGKALRQSDERDLWPSLYRLVAKCNPPILFGEQVDEAVAAGWLDDVFSDLESAAYSCASAILPAYAIGAAHERQRIFFVAESDSLRLQRGFERMQEDSGQGNIHAQVFPTLSFLKKFGLNNVPSPAICRPDDGVSARMVRLCGYGNAIVPQVAREFIAAYMEI